MITALPPKSERWKISPEEVSAKIREKEAQGCTMKWRRRNSVILDCNGQLEGFETTPAYPFNFAVNESQQWEQNESVVTIKRTDDAAGGLQKAVVDGLQDVGGLQKYIRPSDSVALKVNIASGLSDNVSTYTSPRVVEALADEIAKICDPKTGQCAKPYFVEADNIWMDFEKKGKRILEDFGYMELIDRRARHGKPNIPFIHLTTGKKWEGTTKEPFTNRVKFHFLHPTGFTTDLSTFLLDPKTKVISVSKPKQHMWCGISVETKNMYGSYPDGDKSKYHQQDIEGIIAAAARLQRPILALSDWTTVCAGWYGPAICEPFVDNKIVVSNDFLCIDNVGRELAGIAEGTIPHLEINKKLGEGTPWCKFANQSIPLVKAKNPDLIRKAPPKWWFDVGRWLTQTLFRLSPTEIRKMGVNLARPILELANNFMADIYQPANNA